jgi:hypothetical protein
MASSRCVLVERVASRSCYPCDSCAIRGRSFVRRISITDAHAYAKPAVRWIAWGGVGDFGSGEGLTGQAAGLH